MKGNNFKIRVHNKEESAKIQRVLFKLGYNWVGNKGMKNVQHTEKIGLFFDIEDYHTTYTSQLYYFKGHKGKEVTFAKLKSKEFKIYLKKLLILHNLE